MTDRPTAPPTYLDGQTQNGLGAVARLLVEGLVELRVVVRVLDIKSACLPRHESRDTRLHGYLDIHLALHREESLVHIVHLSVG